MDSTEESIDVDALQAKAEAGHMLAQNNLGARYFSGDGVEENLQQAYRFFYLAANQGDRKAGKNLDAIAKKLSEPELEACRRMVNETV